MTDIKRHYVDTLPIPQWGKAPDGRQAKLDNDERLPAIYQQWVIDACDHPQTAVVRQPDSLGRDQYYERCGHCGLRISSAIAHAKVKTVTDRPVSDFEEMERRYCDDRQRAYDAMTRGAAERAQGGNREQYDDYLRSDAWRRKSAKIMRRAGGVCEGCLTNQADDVHHLTYEHIYEEFAFELVALCRACHVRIHKVSANGFGG